MQQDWLLNKGGAGWRDPTKTIVRGKRPSIKIRTTLQRNERRERRGGSGGGRYLNLFPSSLSARRRASVVRKKEILNSKTQEKHSIIQKEKRTEKSGSRLWVTCFAKRRDDHPHLQILLW